MNFSTAISARRPLLISKRTSVYHLTKYKKVFQSKANCLLPQVDKLKHVCEGVVPMWVGAGVGVPSRQFEQVNSGNMGTPCEQTDSQTQLKTLPSHNFIGGR